MSYSNFDRASDLAKARQEMEEAKAELLKRAAHNAKVREERDKQAKLRGDDKWMLPSVSKKIDKIVDEGSKVSKHKKNKKSKKSKMKSKHRSSESSDSSEEEQKIRKKKKKKRKYSSPSSSSKSSADEVWVEKKEETKPLVRDDWLSGVSLMSFTKDKAPKNTERKDLDTYNPAKSDRELNPFWKDGGAGVPRFKKPTLDSDEEDNERRQRSKPSSSSSKTGGWKKRKAEESVKKYKSRTPSPSSGSSSDEHHKLPSSKVVEPKSNNEVSKLPQHDFLTDQQMNELGAKLIKAEIMGNEELAKELKTKLEKAREYRNNFKLQKLDKNSKKAPEHKEEVEDILLTRTTASGLSVPLSSTDPYNKPVKQKRKGKNVETHIDKERVKYFHDDDKYNLKQMFEKEKFTSGQDSDIEFAKIISKHKNPNDDLEDIFADKVRKEITEGESSRRERDEAIREHHEYQKTLENCDRCFDSNRMEKQLIIAMGKNVYLSLPSYEGLQTGHCIIAPMHHVTCATQLDEDVWNEIKDFQKALTRMFESRKQDVVFFETARNLHRKPHMVVHAVPNRDFELLPFYFKKAIQESESDWAVNKQLVDIKKDRDLRRMIPKGLPYFWVHFGTDRGFAHVIEDQHKFPENYAQEIIGGLLNLDPRRWRRPRKEENIITKVKQFADWWKPFDVTK